MPVVRHAPRLRGRLGAATDRGRPLRRAAEIDEDRPLASAPWPIEPTPARGPPCAESATRRPKRGPRRLPRPKPPPRRRPRLATSRARRADPAPPIDPTALFGPVPSVAPPILHDWSDRPRARPATAPAHVRARRRRGRGLESRRSAGRARTWPRRPPMSRRRSPGGRRWQRPRRTRLAGQPGRPGHRPSARSRPRSAASTVAGRGRRRPAGVRSATARRAVRLAHHRRIRARHRQLPAALGDRRGDRLARDRLHRRTGAWPTRAICS